MSIRKAVSEVKAGTLPEGALLLIVDTIVNTQEVTDDDLHAAEAELRACPEFIDHADR